MLGISWRETWPTRITASASTTPATTYRTPAGPSTSTVVLKRLIPMLVFLKLGQISVTEIFKLPSLQDLPVRDFAAKLTISLLSVLMRCGHIGATLTWHSSRELQRRMTLIT